MILTHLLNQLKDECYDARFERLCSFLQVYTVFKLYTYVNIVYTYVYTTVNTKNTYIRIYSIYTPVLLLVGVHFKFFKKVFSKSTCDASKWRRYCRRSTGYCSVLPLGTTAMVLDYRPCRWY